MSMGMGLADRLHMEPGEGEVMGYTLDIARNLDTGRFVLSIIERDHRDEPSGRVMQSFDVEHERYEALAFWRDYFQL